MYSAGRDPVYVVALVTCLIFFQPSLKAGSRPKIDSLKESVKSAKTEMERVNALIAVTVAYNWTDSTEKLNYVNEALLLSKKINWKKGESRALLVKGVIYSKSLNNSIKSLELLQEGYVIAKAISDTNLQSVGLEMMAQAYGNLNNFAKKIDCYREFLALKINSERKIGAYANMGSSYSSLGNYTAALNCYDSAMRLFTELPGDADRNRKDETIAWLKMSVGDIYMLMNDNDNAVGNYKAALTLFENSPSREGTIMALTGIGRVSYGSKNYEKAVEYYNAALSKCTSGADSNDYKSDRLILYNLLGKLYLNKGLISEALGYEVRSLSLIKDDPYNKQVAVTYNLLGDIYTIQKKFDKAVFYLNEAISICKRSGTLDVEKDALFSLSNTYALMKQPAKSLEVYKNYIAVRDSVYSLDKAKEITRHEMNADFAEKQLILKTEQDKKDAIQKAVLEQTLKRQHLAYVTFSVIIILLLVVGLLVLGRTRLRKKLEMQMAIAEERTRISSEMHDDLGSELSKISLLSDLVKGIGTGPNAQAHLDNISRSSRELLDKMGEIVWSLSDKYDTLESLLIYIRRYAKEYFSVTDIDCRVVMPEHFPEVTLEGQRRREIFLVVKEALHNVVKHAGARKVAIVIACGDGSVNIKIHDNGVGVDLANISMFGNGLGNMKARIENVGGTFTIKNEEGTVIDINFPYVG